MQFKLKNNRKYLLKKGESRVLSNVTMTKKLALEFLAVNTEYRKSLFEWLPENVDEMLNPKLKTKKTDEKN